MVTKLSPLAPNVPIVDKDGNPTPYFQRMLDIWLKEKAVAEGDLSTVITDVDTLETAVANLELDDLADVDTATTPPDDGQALIWDDANSEWIPGDVASGGGGSLEFITEASFSAVTNWDIALPDAYDSFDIEFYMKPGTDNVAVSMQVTDDNFATVESGATDYAYSQHRGSGGTTGSSNSNGTTAISVLISSQGNDINEFMSGVFRVINAKEASHPTQIIGHYKYSTNTGNTGVSHLEGSYRVNSSINGIRITVSSGNMTGFYKIWGRKTGTPSPTPGLWNLIYSNASIASGTAPIDLNVSAYDEVLVVGRAVTLASSGYRGVFVSVDGSTYYNTSGNYVSLASNGTEASTFISLNHDTSTSLARNFGGIIRGMRSTSAAKLLQNTVEAGSPRYFVASSSPITHIKIGGLASSAGSYINMNAGSIYVWAR